MKDPRRLVDEGTSILGAHCLRAAQAERAPRSSKLRTLAAVGLTGAGGTFSGVAAGSSAGLLSKWLLLGALSALGGGTLLAAFALGTARPARTPTTRPLRPDVAASSPSSRAVSAEPTALEAAVPAPVASTHPSVPTEPPRGRPASAPSAGSLSAETEALDAARRDLQRDQYPAALRRLDQYQRHFPNGVLAPEASALRVQILHALGRQSEAAESARLFLEQHPRSPLGDRVRSALSAAPPAPHATARR
jgi:hypothetical protein